MILLRRRLLVAAAALPFASGRALAQTPSCGKPTAPQTAGPFFKPRSPETKNLRVSGAKGPLLVVSGLVLSPDCKPVANALLDFWHADESGDYDNDGFRYRGHQFADAQGRWRLETIVPAQYPGRTRHIHVNVQPPGGRLLTTQLYFPGEAGNARDGLYRPELTVMIKTTQPTVEAEYRFVV
jgi:protocatechuate 3,4-dioxygenase beta subunit